MQSVLIELGVVLVLRFLGGCHALKELLLGCGISCVNSHLLVQSIHPVVKTPVDGIIGRARRRLDQLKVVRASHE
jgi:hypothetical protein